MSDPWIGDANHDAPGHCTFAPEPGQPRCGAPATVHIMSESAIYGLVGLVTCDRHAPTARAAGPLLGEHSFTSDCSAPTSWWRLDGCSSDSGAAL